MRPTKRSGPKLGDLLEARGRLTRDVLFRALRHQRAHGGRIGTCLLEVGEISEDDLLHVLSDQAKVPFAEPDDLRNVPEEVRRLVPDKVVRSRSAVPFRASGSQLSVAMLDPQDLLALDELAFVSGRRIRPHIATEMRIQEALGRYYGVEIPGRFVKLLDRINRERYLWARESEATPAADERSSPPLPDLAPLSGAPRTVTAPPGPSALAASPLPAFAPPLRSPAPLPPPLEPTATPETLTPAVSSAPLPTGTSGGAVLSFAQAKARLLSPGDRDDIGAALLGFAHSENARSLLLAVRRETASRWKATATTPGTFPEAGDFEISLHEPSFLLPLREGARLHRGPLAPLPAHASLRELLALDERTDVLGLPLRVRERLVAVWLLAGDALSAGGSELPEACERLATKASAALEMLVLRQKMKRS
jgi:hypothetical protein